MKRAIPGIMLLVVAVVLVTLVLRGGSDASQHEKASVNSAAGDWRPPAAAPRPPAQPRPDISFASLDGKHTFTVPQPGDAEYDDYLEMLAYPRTRSALENSPGYAMPYDPEWRSMITGRREVEKRDYNLRDGSPSLDDLGHALLTALQQAEPAMLFDQRIDEDEFGTLLWPEFPQSRPYLKTPLWEAWGFNHAKGVSGIRSAVQRYGHRKLQLVDIQPQTVKEFTNFQLLENVRIQARDIDNGELVELVILPAVVECNGKFKALNFEG